MQFKQLITRIIELAEIQYNQRKANIVSYDIDLLNKMGAAGKHK